MVVMSGLFLLSSEGEIKKGCHAVFGEESQSFVKASSPNLSKEEQTQLNHKWLEASETGDLEAMDILLEEGADLNASRIYGWTALILASIYGHLEVVKFLSEKGVDLDTRDEYLRTALMYAAVFRNFKVVEFLLEKQADPNAVDKYGWVALMFAIDKEYVEIIRLLLEKQADPKANKNPFVPNILKLASPKKQAEIENLFKEYGVE